MIPVLEDYNGKEAVTDGIGQIANPAQRPVSGYGYVILSRQYNRADYIERCLRNNLLTILTDRNDIIVDCYVTENAWNYIKFPKTIRAKGSCVIWNCPPNSNRATVVATVTKRDELQQLRSENSFKLIRETEDGTVLIEGNVDKGVLNFVVDSDLENGTQVTWRLLNSLTEALFNVYIQGSLKIEVDDSIELKVKNTLNVKFIDEYNPTIQTTFNYTLSEGYTMNDEFGNQITVNKDGVTVIVPNGEKIILQGSTAIQNSVLGNTLVSLVQELISKINQLTVMTPSGVSSVPLNAMDFALISNNAKNILSKINFIS